jgi:hypothetical protein
MIRVILDWILNLFSCVLFNDAVSNSDYTESDYTMINEVKRIWKKGIVA